MKICVIGTGYVGLVGAAVFADMGNTVVGVDKDKAKIAKVTSGVMPIYELGLDEIVLRNVKNGNLRFTTSTPEGVSQSDVIFICVGTPQDDTGAADLTAVMAVAKEVGQNLNGYKIVVTKSTVPVGTNERVEQVIKENAQAGMDFDVVSNPEFLREGAAIEDMRNTNRTVVGTKSARALNMMRELYKGFNAPFVECDLRSAEMIKYASNALLATKISFINEIGQLCERAGANVQVVAEGVGLDKRIGRAFLNATGVGYGGSCFPKDVAALYKTSTDQAYDFKLLRSVMEVNELQKFNFMKKITKAMGENLSGCTIGVLGLAFKNDTDDIRESGAIKMIRMIRGYGAELRVYDPAAMENTKKVFGHDQIYYANDMYDAIKDVDALCIFTEWGNFKLLDLTKTKQLMKGNLIFDARNLLDQKAVESSGFVYIAVGKRTNGYTEDGDIVSTAILKNGR
ncbi:MAG: Nucleotide sugar dehydrogenase [candidate division WWE3 bacterium GW2011_GWB1_44_4]|uniref:UDP-glucose 6-dehydrogenase n=4 Tax=Katanobacteria TaxID=422282 RepID=A0A0G1KP09_UNCKA|nr:MAG: Nucleotide sugar dehydrogenase [candidate division WWE3 bacterium GW2011_GWB1_44_4]KKT85210.1 MAG: Nucleotide sugar dehydrogenase [candidate division WWE3 bacterium GW2011_GWC2_44_9]